MVRCIERKCRNDRMETVTPPAFQGIYPAERGRAAGLALCGNRLRGMTGRLRRISIDEHGLSRRLTRESRFRSERVHPYRYIQEPRDGPAIRVCIHSTFLDRNEEQSTTAFRLLGSLRPEYYEVFRTPGDVDSAFERIPAFSLDEGSDVGRVILTAFGHEVHTGVHYPAQWYDMAQHWVGERAAGRQLVEFKAAEALSAHVFITTSPAVCRLRDQHGSETAVMSPLEALPLLWAWARGFGDYWDGSIVTSAKHYYWALARAITPRGGPGFAALVRGEFIFPNGEELVALGQSALVRLATAIEGVEDMYRAWQLPTDNDTIDQICDGFDQIVLEVAAIIDNLALLAIEYFGLTGLQRHERTLAGDRFLQTLRAAADARAATLADYLVAQRPNLTFHSELRHHAVHRAKLAGISYRHDRNVQEMRIRILEPALGSVCNQLAAAGEDPSQWGISNRVGPHDTPISFVDQPGRAETRHSPGEALLDPMSFAPKLVAATARVVNDVFERLSFETDPALSAEERRQAGAWETISDWPFRAADRDALILTSPLTGLLSP